MSREQWLEKVVPRNLSLQSVIRGIDMTQPDNQMMLRNMASAFEGGDAFKEGSPLMSMLQGFTADIGDYESFVSEPLWEASSRFPDFRDAMSTIAANVGVTPQRHWDEWIPALLDEGPPEQQAEVFRQLKEVLPGLIQKNAGDGRVGPLQQMLNVATLYDDPFEAAAKEFERVKGVWDAGTARAMPSPLSADYPKGLPFYDDKVTLHHASPNLWAPEPGYPHGRARLDFMGEGEGTQAFGHGLYFAENPDVVDTHYMRKLQKEVATEGMDEAWLSTHEEAIEGLRKIYKEGSEWTKTQLKETLDFLMPTHLTTYDQDPDRLDLIDSILGDKYLIPGDSQALEYSSSLLTDVLSHFGHAMRYPSNAENWKDAMAGQAAVEALAYSMRDRLKSARLNYHQGIKTVPPNRYTLSMPKSAQEELLKWEEAIADSNLVQKNLPLDIHEQMQDMADSYERYDSNWDYENTGFMVRRLLPDLINEQSLVDVHLTPAQLAGHGDELDTAKATSQILDNYGISGARYKDGLSRNSRTKAETYNNVIWNQDILNQIKPRIINGVNVPLDDMLPIQRIESWTPRAAIPEKEYFENTHISPLRQVGAPGAAMGVYNGARIISHE